MIDKLYKKNKNLYIFITTTQSPHIEAMFAYAKLNKDYYNDIYFIDLINEIGYRHEYTWRSYLPTKVNLSRKVRNGYVKNYIKNKYKRNYNELDVKNLPTSTCLLSEEQIYSIIKTYCATEFNNPALIVNNSTKEIQYTIIKISKIIDYLMSCHHFDGNDVLIFNGRLPVENTIIMSLKSKSNPCIIYHECNNYKHKIYYSRQSPHDLGSFAKEILEYSRENDALSELSKYKNIISNVKTKKYFSFFTSSNDEFLFFYKNPVNQSKIIYDLLHLKTLNVPIKIRVHPNTKNKSLESKLFYDRLKCLFPDQIINYDDQYSSYDLIRESFLTSSIGSSIAAESIILDVPHLLIGDQSYYKNLNFCICADEQNYIKKIEDELKILVLNPNIYIENCISNKNIAASSLMCEKDIGIAMQPWWLGSYPTPNIH